MNEQTILIIEDDQHIQNFLKLSLTTHHYQTIESNTGLNGISLFLQFQPSLILLDLGLPDVDGLEILSQIRQSSNVPIIVVSARGLEKEKIEALDLGANDYITKPFGINELLARIRATLRRQQTTLPAHEFLLPPLKIDYLKRIVTLNDIEIHFTPMEYKMLVLLTENSGKVVTHKAIQRHVWGYDSEDDYQLLRVFMANIRKKLEPTTDSIKFITTEVGVGYRFLDE